MRQWAEPALVQVMAGHLFGAKPLPEPVQDCCQLDSWEQIQVQWNSIGILSFSFKKMHLKLSSAKMAAILSSWGGGWGGGGVGWGWGGGGGWWGGVGVGWGGGWVQRTGGMPITWQITTLRELFSLIFPEGITSTGIEQQAWKIGHIVITNLSWYVVPIHSVYDRFDWHNVPCSTGWAQY